jgi:leucyl aminopeptidase (aminopeptidase T)
MAVKLIKRRENIATALKTACLEIGCSVGFYSIDTSKMLDANFKWASREIAQRVLRDLSGTDVLIDLTLFGLDEIPAPGLSRLRSFTNLRQELLQGGKLRGADMHIVSDKSFAGGAMCANYENLEKEVINLEGIVKSSRTLDIMAENGTDLRIKIDPKQVFKGTGKICAAGEYHFLPSGIVGICLRKGVVSGKLVLNGPSYAIGTFSEFPMSLEIGPQGKIVDVDLSEKAPYYDLVMNMFKMEEAKYPGELVLGLNPKGDPQSIQSMEFYVARGSVSIALGRNDHIGGDIEPTSEGSVHVHASIPGSTVELDDRRIIVEKGQLMKLGR